LLGSTNKNQIFSQIGFYKELCNPDFSL